MFATALLEFHKQWAWVVVVGNALAGLWALAAHRWPAARHVALWWFTGAVELAVAVQVTVGVIMHTRQNIKAPQFHMFYGFVSLFAVAIIYSYRQQIHEHRYLLYGGGGLFLMGLGLRAMYLA